MKWNRSLIDSTTSSVTISANDSILYKINHITIEGNKRTKPEIILREMTLLPEKKISGKDLDTLIKIDEKRIYNTELFNLVKISPIKVSDSIIDLHIRVYERWYYVILPVFELVDQNFNVWWRDQKRDLTRTKYGFLAVINNVRGRDEDLELGFRWGYTRQIHLAYRFPYINRNKTIGMSLYAFYVANKEVGYTLQDNKLLFIESLYTARQKLETSVLLEHRANIKNIHKLKIGYHRHTISDTIFQLNSNYLYDNKTVQSYPLIEYTYERENRDIKRYPLAGSYMRMKIENDGLGITSRMNRTTIEALYSQYIPLSQKFFYSMNFRAGTVYPYPQSFFNQPLMGYPENYVRGYTYNLIPYRNYATAKTEIKYKLLNKTIKRKKYKKEQFSMFPVKLYLKSFIELSKLNGYKNENINTLNDDWLAVGGLGLDVILLHDSLISLEYAYNRHNTQGLYVNFNITWDFK